MKITQKWIDKHHPCGWDTGQGSVQWWKEKDKEPDPFKILTQLIAEDRLEWANWFVTRLMNHKQQVRYAVYAAEQVIGIYEAKYPDDNCPRLAIKAAKDCLKNPSDKNKKAAAYAADTAARAAADTAVYAAADAAAYAAAYAAYATYAAAYAAAYAARAAAHAAADTAAHADVLVKIIKYGIKILKHLPDAGRKE